MCKLIFKTFLRTIVVIGIIYVSRYLPKCSEAIISIKPLINFILSILGVWAVASALRDIKKYEYNKEKIL